MRPQGADASIDKVNATATGERQKGQHQGPCRPVRYVIGSAPSAGVANPATVAVAIGGLCPESTLVEGVRFPPTANWIWRKPGPGLPEAGLSCFLHGYSVDASLWSVSVRYEDVMY